MNIVFLDIDGVLATATTYNTWVRNTWAARYPAAPFPRRCRDKKAFRKLLLDDVTACNATLLDAACCARVQTLCERADAELIITSTWRLQYPLATLRGWFCEQGLTTNVLGTTPDRGHRGTEIKVIVDMYDIPLSEFVILEDEEDVKPFNGRRVQPSFNGSHAGFRERHLERALTLFGR